MDAPFKVFQATALVCSFICETESEKTPRCDPGMQPAAQCHETCSEGNPKAAAGSAELAANSPGEGGATWREGRWVPILVLWDGAIEGLSTTDLPGKPLGMLPGFKEGL